MIIHLRYNWKAFLGKKMTRATRWQLFLTKCRVEWRFCCIVIAFFFARDEIFYDRKSMTRENSRCMYRRTKPSREQKTAPSVSQFCCCCCCIACCYCHVCSLYTSNRHHSGSRLHVHIDQRKRKQLRSAMMALSSRQQNMGLKNIGKYMYSYVFLYLLRKHIVDNLHG
jgi:hypothetical protein